jgi:hypothetical protein
MKTIILDGIEYSLTPIEVEEIIDNTYPLFAKDIDSGAIVKFTALNTGVIIKKGKYEGSYAVGHISEDFSPHTITSMWKIIGEPRIFWEPTKGDNGFCIDTNGAVCQCWGADDLPANVYETEELAEQARDILEAEYSLRKACFELGGEGFIVDENNYCIAMKGSDLSVDKWYSYKAFPSWFYLPTHEACKKLIETHEAELKLWLSR